MNPEQLLNALTDIHSDFISDARTESPVRKSIRRRFAVLTAAVITVTALAVTALAAEEIGGWFRQYFAKQSDAPLTPGQVEFIEENEQIFNNIQTHNGYTIELKSAIGYGKTTYITLPFYKRFHRNINKISRLFKGLRTIHCCFICDFFYRSTCSNFESL